MKYRRKIHKNKDINLKVEVLIKNHIWINLDN